ncbi:MAG: hypothetical protein ILP16_09520 [Spirochaetales bacterium]|nr:hypothetical protein [Spirochaetales bacterium]
MDFLKIIKEQIKKELAFPALVKVEKVTCSSSGYSIDGRGLRPGSLELTSETFKEIPISPLWADKDGRGLFAPPAPGQIAVVSYLEGNRAYPYVSGIYGEDYKPCGAAADKKLVLTDGNGLVLMFQPSDPQKIEIQDGQGGMIILQAKDPQQLIIKDGKGEQLVLHPEDKLMSINNDTTGMKEILEGIISLISGIKILGGSTSNGGPLISAATLDPSMATDVAEIKAKVSKLLKA